MIEKTHLLLLLDGMGQKDSWRRVGSQVGWFACRCKSYTGKRNNFVYLSTPWCLPCNDAENLENIKMYFKKRCKNYTGKEHLILNSDVNYTIIFRNYKWIKFGCNFYTGHKRTCGQGNSWSARCPRVPSLGDRLPTTSLTGKHQALRTVTSCCKRDHSS